MMKALDKRYTRSALRALVLAACVLVPAGAWVAAERGEPAAAPDEETIERLLEEKRWAEAESLARQLLTQLEDSGRGESPEAARAIDQILRTAGAPGSRDHELVRLAERAVKILETSSPDDDAAIGRAYFTLGNMVRRVVNRYQSIPLYEKAIQHQEAALGPDHPSLARSIANLAILHLMLGDYAPAEPLFERAAGILEASLGADHSDVGIVISAWGSLKHELGDFNGARPLLEREVRIREKTDGARSAGAATARMNLGNILRDMGDLRGAKSQYRRSLRILESVVEPDNPLLGMLYTNLGFASLQSRNFRKAGKLADRALAQPTRDGDLPRRPRGRALYLKAEAWRETGHPDLALSAYKEGLPVLERARGPDHPEVVLALEGMARSRWMLGEMDEALDGALRAERIARGHFRRTVGALPERMALHFETSRQSALDSALSILLSMGAGRPAGAVARVWEAFIRSSAMVVDETAARQRRLVEEAKPGDHEVWQELVEARNHLARLAIKGPPLGGSEAYLEETREAQRRMEAAERAAARASPWYERRVEMDSAGYEEAAASLPEGAVLVRYVRFNRTVEPDGGEGPSYAAFVLRQGRTEPILVPLGDAARMDRLILRWREQVSSLRASRVRPGGFHERRLEKAGLSLRETVWDPVAKVADSAGTAFVVTSGAMSMINLAALPDGQGGFLVERDPVIHHLTTERDLVAAGRPPEPGIGILIVGGPDYEAAQAAAGFRAAGRDDGGGPGPRRPPTTSCAPLRDLSFPPLPGAKEEAEEIARFWESRQEERVLKLTADRASEKAVKELAPGRRIIHMATHGFFLEQGCGRSGGSEKSGRSRAGREPAASPDFLDEHPLLGSGLALAGANLRSPSADEDGILTAEEVAGLDLSGVEWIVLSACETGIGRVMGAEGIAGLRRALRIAGARTVVMSLWHVEDRATRSWMSRLYEARLAGLSTSESMRQASVETLADLRRRGRSTHPASWGAFVAVGDWR